MAKTIRNHACYDLFTRTILNPYHQPPLLTILNHFKLIRLTILNPSWPSSSRHQPTSKKITYWQWLSTATQHYYSSLHHQSTIELHLQEKKHYTPFSTIIQPSIHHHQKFHAPSLSRTPMVTIIINHDWLTDWPSWRPPWKPSLIIINHRHHFINHHQPSLHHHFTITSPSSNDRHHFTVAGGCSPPRPAWRSLRTASREAQALGRCQRRPLSKHHLLRDGEASRPVKGRGWPVVVGEGGWAGWLDDWLKLVKVGWLRLVKVEVGWLASVRSSIKVGELVGELVG